MKGSEVSDEDFIRGLHDIYGEHASPSIMLRKALMEDSSGRFTVEAITERAQRLGFRVQVRDCTRNRRQMRFTFRPNKGQKAFLKWLREGPCHDQKD